MIDTRSICLHSGIPRRSAHTSFSLPMGGTCSVPSVKIRRSLVAVHHLKLHAQDRSFPLKQIEEKRILMSSDREGFEVSS
jgi:hypothetical protein